MPGSTVLLLHGSGPGRPERRGRRWLRRSRRITGCSRRTCRGSAARRRRRSRSGRRCWRPTSRARSWATRRAVRSRCASRTRAPVTRVVAVGLDGRADGDPAGAGRAVGVATTPREVLELIFPGPVADEAVAVRRARDGRATALSGAVPGAAAALGRRAVATRGGAGSDRRAGPADPRHRGPDRAARARRWRCCARCPTRGCTSSAAAATRHRWSGPTNSTTW